MAQFKKQAEHTFWHSPLVLGVLFCLVIVFAYNMIGLFEKERETAKKKNLTLEEIDGLHKRQAVLSTEIKKLDTDDGVEDMIRDKYQVVKPGEKVVMIVDPDDKVGQTAEMPVDHSFWGYIKKAFGQ